MVTPVTLSEGVPGVSDEDGIQLRGRTYWTDFYFKGQRVRRSLRTRDRATALERLGFLRAGLDEAGGHVVSAAAPSASEAGAPAAGAEDENGSSSGFGAHADGYLRDLRLRTEKRNSIRCAEYQVKQLLKVVPELRRRRLKREDLRKFIEARRADGVSAATINQGLSVVKSES